jgi:hypothetical protein
MKDMRKSSPDASKQNILFASEQGYLVFLNHYPQLWMVKQFGLIMSFDSPFHKERDTFSIYYHKEKGKWFFKDHVEDGLYGDVFTFIAALYKLNFKRDFKKILEITAAEIKQVEQPNKTYQLVNNATGEFITFFKEC